MFSRLLDGETAARKDLLRALPKDAVGVEIGVWKGDFSSRLLKGTAPRQLHLIDPWLVSDGSDRSDEAWYGAGKTSQSETNDIHDKVKERFAQEVRAGTVIIHRTTSAEAMQAMPDASVDYVYIDGDHSYDGVSQDLLHSFRVTRPGGFICCDDYLAGAWWKDGVIRAVHEFLAARPVIIHSKANSQIVIRKRIKTDERGDIAAAVALPGTSNGP